MRLAPERYVELLRADGEQIAATAERGLDREVPPCPGWDVREAVRHTGSVYLHKIATMRAGRSPEKGEWQTAPPQGEDLVMWFRAAHAALVDELLARGPDSPSPTWWPPEQRVGFWFRRMALETVVHRVDVESAFGALGPVPADLAVDGIGEVLEIFLTVRDNPPANDGARGAVLVRGGPEAWRVDLDAAAVHVQPAQPDATSSAVVSGDPPELFLYLWGRVPEERVQKAGDEQLARALRTRLAAATT